MTAHRLNRELVSYMTTILSGKAWGFAKSVPPANGLEAWRQVYQHITMQGPMQVQDEYDYLIKPDSPNSVASIPSWINAWEDRARKLAATSSAHTLPNELRRNIFYKSMPKAVSDKIQEQRNFGLLQTFEEMRKWLMNLGTNVALVEGKRPSPSNDGE